MGVGNENEYEKKESILKAKDIFECLQRRSNQSLVFEDVLDAISYSKYVGFIPFGVQPTDGPSVGSIQTPQIKNFKASQVFWDVLLESTSLCSYTSEEERKNALKILLLIEKNQQEQQESIEIKETWQSIEELRKRFYLERSIYFDIRIEIFRIALFTSSDSLQQHPNRRLTERLVEYFLLKENLVQNLLSELNARQKMKARDLLTEIELKGSLKASIDSISMKKFRGHMRHAWDEQFVQEYTQLLELLLLALYASKGDIGLPILMRLARFFHDANFSLPMELFAKSSLSLEIFQSKLKRVTALSTMLLVSVISMLPMASNILENQLIDVTESFFLGEFRQKALGIEIFPSKINEEGIDIDTSILSMEEEEFGVNSGTMQPQGFVFLAFASLLGRLCNVASSTLRTEVEQKAREILSLAHSLQGFTYFHTVLQVLIQSEQKSFMNSFDPNAKCWQLPQGFLLSSSSFTTIPTAQAYMQQQVQAYTQPVFNFNGSLAIYQQVAVGFLKDVLGPLGFDASLEDPHQFQVMVQMISPALCHPQIAESILSQKDEAASNILVKFLLKGKQFASCRGGNNFLPLLKLYTSLVSGIRSSSSSSQWSLQIVHDLTVLEVQGNDRMRHHTTAFSTGTNRLLPPEHFLIRDFRSDQIVASSTFAYPEDNLVIPQGTIGLVNSKGTHVTWDLLPEKNNSQFFSTTRSVSINVWDCLVQNMEKSILGLEIREISPSSIQDLEIVVSFLELLIQLGKTQTNVVIHAISVQFARSRLKNWCIQHGLEHLFGHFVSRNITWSQLARANRENLMQWGISDRLVREKIISGITSSELFGTSNNGKYNKYYQSYEADGLGYLVGLLFRLLETFSQVDRTINKSSSKLYYQLTSAALGTLNVCAGSTIGVDVLSTFVDIPMDSTMSDELTFEEEGSFAVEILLKCTKMIFEGQESHEGTYWVLCGTLQLLQQVFRYAIAQETLAKVDLSSSSFSSSSSSSSSCIIWIEKGIDFVLEILSSCENWSFQSVLERWRLEQSCFQMVETLLLADANKKQVINALRQRVWSDSRLQCVIVRGANILFTTKMHTPKCLLDVARPSSSTSSSFSTKEEEKDKIKTTTTATTIAATKSKRLAFLEAAHDQFQQEKAGYSSEIFFVLGSGSDKRLVTICEERYEMEKLVVTSLRLVHCLLKTSMISCSTSTTDIMALLLRNSNISSISSITTMDTKFSSRSSSAVAAGDVAGNNFVSLCAYYLAYPVEKNLEVSYWSLQIIRQVVLLGNKNISSLSSSNSSFLAIKEIDTCTDRSNTMPSGTAAAFVSFFPFKEQLVMFCDTFLQLLTAPKVPQYFKQQLIRFLTESLRFQPALVALFFMPPFSSSKSSSTSSLLTILERFLKVSDQKLEVETDFCCVVLQFLMEIWQGAVKGLALHVQIASELRKQSHFWHDLTRPLCVRIPEESSLTIDQVLNELHDTTRPPPSSPSSPSSPIFSSLYMGRGGAYGLYARGLLLKILSIEWHYHHVFSSSSSSTTITTTSLEEIFEKFRLEDLYTHWLSEFTRLHYESSRFLTRAKMLKSFYEPLQIVPSITMSNCKAIDIFSAPEYCMGIVCDTSLLRWKIGNSNGGDDSIGDASGRKSNGGAFPMKETLKLLKQAELLNLEAAQVHAQEFLLDKWKTFMELCCLQPGNHFDSCSKSTSTSRSSSPEKVKTTTTNSFLSRKESMINSPPRMMTTSSTSTGRRMMKIPPPSPMIVSSSLGTTSTFSNKNQVTSLSKFAGDRTSFRMIHVLAEELNLCATKKMDFIVLVHIERITEMLMSMLHHQFTFVLVKTFDPKLSQTKQRPFSTSRLNFYQSFFLLKIIDKLCHHLLDKKVFLLDKNVFLLDKNVFLLDKNTTFVVQKSIFIFQILKSLFTSALLLVRHLTTSTCTSDSSTSTSTSTIGNTCLLHLIQHCLDAIQWSHHDPTSSVSMRVDDMENMENMENMDEKNNNNKNNAAASLFQVSLCLFQELLHSKTIKKITMDEPIEVTLQNIFCLLVEKKKIDQLFGLIEKNLIIHSTITTIKKNDQQQKCSLDILMVFISMICDGNQQIARVFLQKHFFRSLTTRLIPFLTKKIVFDHQNPRGYRKLLDMNMNMNMDSGRKRPTTAMAASKTTTTFPTFERCMYHQVWCLLLRLVGETLGLLGDPMVADVLDFVCHSEKIFVSAMELPFNNYNVPSLEPSEQQEEQKLTLALMEERQSIVHVLIALSDFQIQWRQRMPNGFVFFIEKTRQLFKNSCLFLSNGTSFSHQTRLFEHTKAISEEEKRLCCLYPKQQDQDEDIVKPIATATVSTATSEKLDKEPRTPSPKSKSTRLSSSSFSSSSLMKMTASPIVSESKQHFSMRKQSSSIHDDRRTKPIHAVFYDVMEKNLLKFVFEASTLFLKLTPPIQTVIVIDGVTHIDEEASYPIFDFIPPTQCNFMTPPSLGHLCLAMEYCMDQLKCFQKTTEENKEDISILNGVLNTCTLLVWKNYILHLRRYDHEERIIQEFKAFFEEIHRQGSAAASLKEEQSSSSLELDEVILQQLVMVR